MLPRLCGATLASLKTVLAPASSHSLPEPVLQAILDRGMTGSFRMMMARPPEVVLLILPQVPQPQ